MNNNKPIFVTQPDLPELKDVIPLLERIWDNKWLTNAGEFHQKLENKLAKHLGVPYISLFSNGTLALIVALQHLKITGEVITTPFTFVATTHSLIWNNIKPIFVDIENEYGNIDTSKIEAAITPQTTAILAVHVFGNPVNTTEIERIAKKHNLKVIYDAAHAFGVKRNGKSILNSGDLSILSFHATKVFNTFEGGAIVCQDEKTKKNIDLLKNFGIQDEENIIATGINAKMNEFQAAIGLLQLNRIDDLIKKRKLVSQKYDKEFNNVKGIRTIKKQVDIDSNFAYYPIFVDKESFGMDRDDLHEKLKRRNIFSRKYFYPLISNIKIYKDFKSSDKSNLPTANIIANNVLCLPIYPNLDLDTVDRIINTIIYE